MGRSTQDIHIDCVERDNETYLEASRDPILKNKNIVIYRNDVFKFLDRFPNREYDVIWLDLCAQMTINLIQQVGKIVMSNRIANKSYLAVTFMGSREHNDILELFQTDEHEIIRTKLFPEYVINSAISANRVCKLVACHKYKNDTYMAAPMRLYVFSIETLLSKKGL